MVEKACWFVQQTDSNSMHQCWEIFEFHGGGSSKRHSNSWRHAIRGCIVLVAEAKLGMESLEASLSKL